MIIGNTIFERESCADSMAWARSACFNSPDGSLFIPKQLTQAHGRQGREWILCEGQLTKTILLKPTIFSNYNGQDAAYNINHLGMALCLGILKTISIHGVSLKWPNDFILAHKKMGGMLLDLVWLGNKPYALIIGFSLNINNTFSEKHPLKNIAISLNEVINKTTNLTKLDAHVLSSLDNYYKLWLLGERNIIFQEWKKYQQCLGSTITVHQVNGTSITGITSDFTETGNLILTNNNSIITIPFFIVDSFA